MVASREVGGQDKTRVGQMRSQAQRKFLWVTTSLNGVVSMVASREVGGQDMTRVGQMRSQAQRKSLWVTTSLNGEGLPCCREAAKFKWGRA